MIKYLYANNYKSFVNFKLDLNSMSLFLGNNGSGKSNAMLLIFKIVTLIRGNKQPLGDLFPNRDCTRWMKSNIQTFELGFEKDANKFVYHLEIEQDFDTYTSRIINETIKMDNLNLLHIENGMAEVYDEISENNEKMFFNPLYSQVNSIPQDKRFKSLSLFRECVNSIIYCVPDPKRMSSIVENDVYYPEIDMSNISSLFAGVVQIFPDFQRNFTNTMKDINPYFGSARISLESYPKRLVVDHDYKGVVCSYYLEELSEGEKNLIAIYLLINAYLRRGNTLLLDEPDNYLSLREIQPLCMELEELLLDSGQCIMISHHPEVIDYFTDVGGIWFSKIESGETVIRSNPFYQQDEEKILPYSKLIVRGIGENN